MLADLRESRAIEQDADVVAFLYRDEVYDDSEDNPHKGTADLIIAKHCAGPLATIWLDWQEQHTRFESRGAPPPQKSARRQRGNGAHWTEAYEGEA